MPIIKAIACFYFWPIGRLGRRGYWTLFSTLIAISFTGLGLRQFAVVSTILTYGIFVPVVVALARRLHDLNLSGWWVFLIFAPALILGAAHRMDLTPYGSILRLLTIIVMGLIPGTPGDNRFGPPDLTFTALGRNVHAR